MHLQFGVEYDWAPVTCTDGSAYQYPGPVRNVHDSFHGPAVYRWRFMDGDRLAALYVGECDELIRELSASVNPAQGNKSGGRIKAALGERMLLGQTGTVDVLKIRNLSIGGKAITGIPLREKSIRRAIESLLIYEAAREDVELLNQETSARDLLSLL